MPVVQCRTPDRCRIVPHDARSQRCRSDEKIVFKPDVVIRCARAALAQIVKRRNKGVVVREHTVRLLRGSCTRAVPLIIGGTYNYIPEKVNGSAIYRKYSESIPAICNTVAKYPNISFAQTQCCAGVIGIENLVAVDVD